MPSTFVIHGTGGRLRCGARTAATLKAWRADSLGGNRFRVSVDAADRDPYWWDNYDPSKLTAELTIGNTSTRFIATIVSTDPIVLELMRRDDAED